MGFSTLIDIAGSMFIGGIILLNLLNLNNNLATNSFYYSNYKNSQVDLVILASVIERDFNLIGYSANYNAIKNDSTIIYGDSSSIRFLSDFNNDGNFDTVYFYIGNVNELLNTTNPRDRLLYRRINNNSPKIIGSVTEFKLSYFDGLMNEIHSPIIYNSNVNFIRVSLRVESSFPVDDRYSDAIWKRMTVTTKNIVKK